MGRGNKLDHREHAAERPHDRDLPGRVQVEIELVEQHQSLHLPGFHRPTALGEHLPDQIRDPGDHPLITLREGGRGQPHGALSRPEVEPSRLHEMPRPANARLATKLDVIDAWQQVLALGQNLLENACVLPRQLTGRPARSTAAARLDPTSRPSGRRGRTPT